MLRRKEVANVARALVACAAPALVACGGSTAEGQAVVVDLGSEPAEPAALAPAKAGSQGGSTVDTAAPPAPIAWAASPEQARERALRERKPMLVFFRAEWSTPSLMMERDVFVSPSVERAARPFVTARVDATDETSSAAGYWLQNLGVLGLPAIVLFDPAGSRRDVIEGLIDADELTRRLNDFVSEN